MSDVGACDMHQKQASQQAANRTALRDDNGELKVNEKPKRRSRCLLGLKYIFFVVTYSFTNKFLFLECRTSGLATCTGNEHHHHDRPPTY